MKVFEDRFWSSRDGLTLHFRDYPGPGSEGSRLPVLCLHGLTRNARDFDVLAPRVAAGRRVICPDLRGRGDSEYAKDSGTYNPAQYAEDVLALIEQENLDRFVVIGTSLGGLVAMSLATMLPGRIAGAVINDVGPSLEPTGLGRIKDYVGQGRSWPTWVHAARGLEDIQGRAHPNQPLDFWIGIAKRLMTVSGSGRIVFDYDMKVAEPIIALDVEAQPDLWDAWDALARVPVLVVRGALSDLLSAETLAKMLSRAPGAEALTLEGIGHAPTLDEPESVVAIMRLLDRAV
ncbi:alpha/beta fold hydrolase [Novosphingobium panipatense]|uniref:Pimeloyl-ACP methyl ester carboxylesterase n=1 Tax=Novosphingobium panipatense TaxID=428991 RepID=A0ABY1QG97_9SPHN|nr:alpha/beta hydrolase [Novosphingobium panipatense]SMP69824.1 Pimeloyl-ACP methyl ester carboxylesterase [Novosphingobium panipatense]